jgi:hypothetical protein
MCQPNKTIKNHQNFIGQELSQNKINTLSEVLVLVLHNSRLKLKWKINPGRFDKYSPPIWKPLHTFVDYICISENNNIYRKLFFV